MNWRFKFVEFGFAVLVTASFTLSCACVVSARVSTVSMIRRLSSFSLSRIGYGFCCRSAVFSVIIVVVMCCPVFGF